MKSLEKIILETINNIFDESGYNFLDWWKDDFESEICINSKEELFELSPDELEILQMDWVCSVIDGYLYKVVIELGLDTEIKTKAQERFLEELYGVVKFELFKKTEKVKSLENHIFFSPETLKQHLPKRCAAHIVNHLIRGCGRCNDFVFTRYTLAVADGRVKIRGLGENSISILRSALE